MATALIFTGIWCYCFSVLIIHWYLNAHFHFITKGWAKCLDMCSNSSFCLPACCQAGLAKLRQNRQQKVQTCMAAVPEVQKWRGRGPKPGGVAPPYQGRPKAPHLGPLRQTPRPLCAPAPGAATEGARPGTLVPVTTGQGGPLRVTQAGLSGAMRRARTRPEVACKKRTAGAPS